MLLAHVWVTGRIHSCYVVADRRVSGIWEIWIVGLILLIFTADLKCFSLLNLSVVPLKFLIKNFKFKYS